MERRLQRLRAETKPDLRDGDEHAGYASRGEHRGDGARERANAPQREHVQAGAAGDELRRAAPREPVVHDPLHLPERARRLHREDGHHRDQHGRVVELHRLRDLALLARLRQAFAGGLLGTGFLVGGGHGSGMEARKGALDGLRQVVLQVEGHEGK